jgi:hypothetical protein
MTTVTPKPHWYHPTPARFFIGLLAVQVLLFLSERFRWFPFNEHKGWTVLIAVGVVGLAVVVMLIWGLVCLCLRRRFQFSFRSLLVFVVTVSVPMGWFAWEMERARQQREVVERIVELGGKTYYDYDLQYDERKHDWIAGPQPATPTWLCRFLGEDFFCDVIGVHLYCKDCDDEDVAHLKSLPELKWLSLRSRQVTDAGVQHLHGLTNWIHLDLSDTSVSDEGVRHLQGMTNLQELCLHGMAVSNDGLRHVVKIRSLRKLYVDEHKVTEEGIKAIKRALPDCSVSVRDEFEIY